MEKNKSYKAKFIHSQNKYKYIPITLLQSISLFSKSTRNGNITYKEILGVTRVVDFNLHWNNFKYSNIQDDWFYDTDIRNAYYKSGNQVIFQL